MVKEMMIKYLDDSHDVRILRVRKINDELKVTIIDPETGEVYVDDVLTQSQFIDLLVEGGYM